MQPLKFYEALKAGLCEAVYNHIRFHTPDHNGETRRQRYANFDELSPHISIPLAGAYLWDWFFDLSNMRQDSDKRIAVSEFKSWSDLTERSFTGFEFKILRSMDESYVSAFRREVRENQDRINRHNEQVAKLRGR